jgi:TPR repeat protein
MAENNDPAAENALGLRYFQGDAKNLIARDEVEASRWFLRAADHGSLAAQAKLGAIYWGGRGVPKDVNEAYFWTVLARARGDKDSKDLAHILANGMTHSQTASIEQKADLWLQQHIANWKPAAGH